MPLWFSFLAGAALTWGGIACLRMRRQLRANAILMLIAAFFLFMYTGFGLLLTMGID